MSTSLYTDDQLNKAQRELLIEFLERDIEEIADLLIADCDESAKELLMRLKHHAHQNAEERIAGNL